ncbi:zinc ribbon domain-containing protein [Actinoplanes sp. NPDC049599]|uniref:zinc ribbon domain-containing protein n=1 Tax=Actinoplanes sp. NPDC049599 TaxID=3363903 RepID=UPI00379D49A9
MAGLGRTRLAKSVHDAGWASFTGMLEDKAARYGRAFGRVDRFFPSTRMCSACGRINEKMPLEVRAFPAADQPGAGQQASGRGSR